MSELQVMSFKAVDYSYINRTAAKRDEPDNKHVEATHGRQDCFENIDDEEYIGSLTSAYSKSSVYASRGIYDSRNFSSTSISKTRMICNRAGLTYDVETGGPVISTGADLVAYRNASDYLNKFTPISVYNSYDNPDNGVTKTIYTQDHQYFLYALTDKYDSAAKGYYSYKGYKIDAYMIMGIGFGESNASQTSSNPFGALAPLSTSSINKATDRAIQALQNCGLAANIGEAKSLMASDPFYQKAAEVLSYLDNGYNYRLDPMNVYSTFDQANQNAERWRTAVANNSQNKQDFAYYYYK